MNKPTNQDTLEIALEDLFDDEALVSTASTFPSPDVISYYVLEKDRKIFIDTEIDNDIFCYIRLILRWGIEDKGKPVEERKPIWIYLSSNGGSADAMFSMLDAIHCSKTPIYTVNMGNCYSSAALIFLAGEKRFMMPHASVLIHSGANYIGGDAVKVIDGAESYKRMLASMREYILKRTEIPAATLNKKKNNDWELSIDDCVKYGVCTNVVSCLEDVM